MFSSLQKFTTAIIHVQKMLPTVIACRNPLRLSWGAIKIALQFDIFIFDANLEFQNITRKSREMASRQLHSLDNWPFPRNLIVMKTKTNCWIIRKVSKNWYLPSAGHIFPFIPTVACMKFKVHSDCRAASASEHKFWNPKFQVVAVDRQLVVGLCREMLWVYHSSQNGLFGWRWLEGRPSCPTAGKNRPTRKAKGFLQNGALEEMHQFRHFAANSGKGKE